MFTGLVVERGRVIEFCRDAGTGSARLRLAHSPSLASRLELGASLAVAGTCLTVAALDAESSTFELSPETLSRTTLGGSRAGRELNLEPALRLGDALGGHWVQGHVDTVVHVLARRDLGEHRVLAFELPAEQAAFVVEKGSVTLDGVSLTVAALGVDRFEVALIPHTLELTTLGALEPGDAVNFEADILAKHVARAAAVYAAAVDTGGARP